MANRAIMLPGQLPRFGADVDLVGMKLWLPMNEKAGSRFNNLIDSLNPGVMTGGSWSGNGVILDGIDDLITLNRLTDLVDWTVAIKYTPATVSGQHPIIDSGDILIRQSDDDVIYGATDSTYTDSTDTLSASLTADKPIIIIATRSGSTIEIWGFTERVVHNDSFTASGTALTSLTNLVIGSQARASFVFPALPTLTTENGMVINGSDDVRYTIGSASLNSATITENWNSAQKTTRIRTSLSFVPGDGLTHYFFDNQGTSATNNRERCYIDTAGLLTYVVHDTDGTQHLVSFDISGWAAGAEHQIVCVIDFKNDRIELYTDGTSRDATPDNALSSDSIDAVESTTQIGADTSQANQLNGSMTIQAFSRAWTATEVGDDDPGIAFVVDQDTLFMADFTQSGTGVVYPPSGKTVSAVVNGATESTLTTAAGIQTAAYDGEGFRLGDGTGFGVKVFADGDPSGDATMLADDSAGALVTDIELVGVHANLNGTSHFFNATDANFPAAGITGATDITIMAWIKPSALSGFQSILTKWELTGNKKMYGFWTNGDQLHMNVSSNGILDDKGQTTSGANLAVDRWTHVAVVYDASAGTADFYKDGVFVEQETGLYTTIADKDPSLGVGMYNSGGLLFPGGIRNVSLFNDKRTAAEILTSATTPLEDLSAAGNIIGQWYFTDGPTVTVIDNNEGTAGGDLVLNGGDTTDYSTHTRLTEAFISRNLLTDGNMENGGIGAWTVGDAATTLTKETTAANVFADIQSLKVLNGDGTQGFARQTLTTVANQDYLFHGRFFAPATPNGASQLVDVDLTAALGITVTQAGLSAGWNEIEFTFQAADVSTTIDLGSGSVTNTEAGYWDEAQMLTQLVTQGGCEAADGNALPTGWSDTGSPDADETQTDSADQHAGATSILLNNCDADEGVTQDVTVVVDQYYTFSFWEKNNAQDINAVLSDAATATIDATGDNSWTEHGFTFKAATTTLTIKFTSGAADQSSWIDDVKITRLDTRAANTADRTRDFADGKIEAMAIWDRSMNATEVQARRDFVFDGVK